jgi:adenylate cyclase
MAIEIERKFLLANNDWRGLTDGIVYRQGYLCATKEGAVRVRLVAEQGFLTIKGPTEAGRCDEYEYEIPAQDAREMLDHLCPRPQIEKKRYRIEWRGLAWEIDEFFGENAGLVVAEIELTRADQPFERPDWLGEEVTGDARYYNAMLCVAPFTGWGEQGQ